ncbi:MAG: DNA topoisomerase IB [Caldilineaceae bacterium]|nr:DNA topoisomerase IB [Caldilineaceae bacterium]
MTPIARKRALKRARKTLEQLLSQDAAEAAALAGLRYVNDEEPGIRRKRWGRGFTYVDAAGKHLRDETIRTRCLALAIPPAWTDVWICEDSSGHIQATGRDDEGRKQYIYHEVWEAARSANKFGRLALFGYKLPGLRAQVDRDLRRHNFPLERMVALVVYLLDKTHIRIGNLEYVQDGAYGLTTLLSEHLSVNGEQLHFDFTGKSGKRHEIDLHDRRLARLVQRCQELPGQFLFMYEDEAGELRQVLSTDVNSYLRAQMGQSFSAKDFRTWGATTLAAEALLQHVAQQEAPQEEHITAAIKVAAQGLGHTTTVCRTYYVHPALLTSYCQGLLQAPAEPQPRLSTAETAVLNLLFTELAIPPELLPELLAEED